MLVRLSLRYDADDYIENTKEVHFDFGANRYNIF